MPTWVWVLVGLAAIAGVAALLNREMGSEGAERFGRALAIFFILAVVGGLMLGFWNMDWR